MRIEVIDYYLGSKEIENREIIDPKNWDRFISRAGFLKTFKVADSDEFEHWLENNYFFSSNYSSLITHVIYCSSTPRSVLELSAVKITKMLKLSEKVITFDLNEACTGFSKALYLGSSIIDRNPDANILIVNADIYSKLTPSGNPSLSTLFSDCISISVLGNEIGTESSFNLGELIDFVEYSDDNLSKLLYISQNDPLEIDLLHMNGAKLLNSTLIYLPQIVEKLFDKNALVTSNINTWLVHQGSRVVCESVIDSLGLVGIDSFQFKNIGNCVSASIPVYIKNFLGKDNSGTTCILTFGMGFSINVGLWRTT
jgi:3-oxoacyl-[acyl-carrier-protein] synthase-3